MTYSPAHSPTHLASLDWPWQSEDPAIHIILVSDEQFINLANRPDEAIEKIFPQDPEPISLREHCRRGAERGATKLLIAYDYFFGGSSRGLYPDTPEFQATLKKISDVAQAYGLSLEPSILSPLELGAGYKARAGAGPGQAGRWMHYREALRDPQTGAYSALMWQHTRWCNNKGPTPVTLIGARAFAFREQRIPGTSFFSVDPDGIVELEPPAIEPMPGTSPYTGALAGGEARQDIMFQATRIRAHGSGGPAGLDRVLVVLIYDTDEMDYFSPAAPQFLDALVNEYHQHGIKLAGLYSDEMHIQQDWSYHTHFDNGQFNLRYVSAGFERAFAARYGAQYADFARWLVYFTAHQHDFLPTHEPKLPSQHVFGAHRAAIAATLQFRRDYYHFLESGVVNLMNGARKKLEALIDRELDAYYHSTWAESPTCDAWAPGGVQDSWSPAEHRSKYEYTPDFLWSNTVHQAASACANQFLWNDFLTGGNNDTPEGGYADRNYYARALACSLAALNRRPLASAGMWGMPQPVADRMMAVSEVYGALGHPIFRAVEDYAPRSIEVLFLYPQDLMSVDERFGSWMSLYGYANLITAEKLVEYGRVTEDGWLEVAGPAITSRYRAVCAQYEPFPSEALLDLLSAFVEKGGLLIWSSVPPLAAQAGALDTRQWMSDVFGVELLPIDDPLGQPMPGRQVAFSGALRRVPAQTILTDFVVDRVFPVKPIGRAQPVATLATGRPEGAWCVGARKTWRSGGQAVYLGFRPRDDQAASTGIETRTWFEALRALGAYPASGVFDENDNPSVVSRTGNLLACAFANGALAVCPHFKDYPENWPGGFFRDQEVDARIMTENPPPDDFFELRDWRVAGQTVSYAGRHAAAWRRDAAGALVAFAGHDCTDIEIDGQRYQWSDAPVDIGWHPLAPEQATEGYRPLYRVWCGTPGQVRAPLALPAGPIEVWLGAHMPGSRSRRPAQGRAGYGERQVAFRVEDGALALDIDDTLAGHWLYVVAPAQQSVIP